MSELIQTIEDKCQLDKHPWLCKIVQCVLGVLIGNGIVLLSFFYFFNRIAA